QKRNYYAAATALPRPEYRWCYAEQVDQAAPLPDRSNGWRYLGPREGETYRRQAVFGAGFRLRLPFPRLSPGPGHRWFNSHPLGGDPDLPDFQAWARDDAAQAPGAQRRRRRLAGGLRRRRGRRTRTARRLRRRRDLASDTLLGITGPKDRCEPARHPYISRGPAGSRRRHIGGSALQTAQYRILRPPTREVRSLTEFGVIWKERLPGACLAVLVADSWRDCQVGLLARDRRRFGFRDVDPLTGAFMDSRAGGRSKKGVKRAPPNAMDGGNYFRNLYSIMLERDVGSTEFSAWLSGEECVPAVTVRHLDKWLKTTKASVVVWSHRARGRGCRCQGPDDEPPSSSATCRRSRGPRVPLGARWPLEGSLHRRSRGAVGPSLHVAVEHCVRTRRLFRRIAEAAEEGREEKSDGDTRTFGRCADMTEAILTSSQTDTDQQTARKRRRGTDDKADSKRPGTHLPVRLWTSSCSISTSVAWLVRAGSPATATGIRCLCRRTVSSFEPGAARAWADWIRIHSNATKLLV
ncbi:unnamed protein product, partial [Ectocarpus sp. 6 AP-2014]